MLAQSLAVDRCSAWTEDHAFLTVDVPLRTLAARYLVGGVIVEAAYPSLSEVYVSQEDISSSLLEVVRKDLNHGSVLESYFIRFSDPA